MNKLLVGVVLKEVLYVCEGLLILPQVCELNKGLAESFVEGFLVLSKLLNKGL
jgi:hypothetical protein